MHLLSQTVETRLGKCLFQFNTETRVEFQATAGKYALIVMTDRAILIYYV